MDLDDVGKEVEFIDDTHWPNPIGKKVAKVIMVIKAPRGICRLFEQPLYRGYVHQARLDNQCLAIRAFMGEHKDD